MREKRKKHPEPFQIITPNFVQNGDFEVQEGETQGLVEGYSTLLLDVLCAPLETGERERGDKRGEGRIGE
jgi:hypothetical protein